MAEDRRPTPRQLEILSLAAAGLNREQIASQLFLSPNTVRRHLQDIQEILGASNVTHSVTIAVAQGYLRIDLTASGAPKIVQIIEIDLSTGPAAVALVI